MAGATRRIPNSVPMHMRPLPAPTVIKIHGVPTRKHRYMCTRGDTDTLGVLLSFRFEDGNMCWLLHLWRKRHAEDFDLSRRAYMYTSAYELGKWRGSGSSNVPSTGVCTSKQTHTLERMHTRVRVCTSSLPSHKHLAPYTNPTCIELRSVWKVCMKDECITSTEGSTSSAEAAANCCSRSACFFLVAIFSHDERLCCPHLHTHRLLLHLSCCRAPFAWSRARLYASESRGREIAGSPVLTLYGRWSVDG